MSYLEESKNTEIKVGSKVRLKDGQNGTQLNPPLENGRIYTIKEVQQSFDETLIELEKDFESHSHVMKHKYYAWRFEPIESVHITHTSGVTICPTCKRQEWKEIWSDWAKEHIQKCSNCGYC